MSVGAQYVVAAYAVILFALLVYVIVAGMRTARMAREAELLARLVEREQTSTGDAPARRPELEPERA